MAAVSNDVAAAILDVINANWRSYVPDQKKPLLFLEEEDVASPQAPAIGIFDGGSTTNWETMRGRNPATGVLKAGIVQQRFRFDLQVWIKGRRSADTLTTMNEYRAGIKAILQDNPTLGGISADIQVDADEPSIEMTERSASLRIGVIRANVDTWTQQGTGTLL